MKRHRATLLAASLIAATALAAGAPVPQSLFGVYVHESKTCGGPGSADDPKALDCGLVFDDEMLIEKHLDGRTAGAEVYFSFHYGYGDYCLLDGEGDWDAGVLRLRSVTKPTPDSCKLSLSAKNGDIQVSDPGNACRQSLCTAPGATLNELVFKRKQ